MPRALSDDLAWRVVWKRLMYAQTDDEIASHLLVHARTVQRVMRRFRETGNVATNVGRRLASPSNVIMTFETDMKLLELVTLLDDKSMLQEIHSEFCALVGATPHISTICRAMRRLNFTRKKVSMQHAR